MMRVVFMTHSSWRHRMGARPACQNADADYRRRRW
jgi:hypothetical protein